MKDNYRIWYNLDHGIRVVKFFTILTYPLFPIDENQFKK
jgi:hypothetical protein